MLTDMHQNMICGKRGEEIARDFLIKKEYAILETNVHSRFGEIDIIAVKSGMRYFCEVKTRTTDAFGTPEEAVNWKKLQRIKKTIQWYHEKYGYAPFQIDVLSIYLTQNLQPRKIVHYKNVS